MESSKWYQDVLQFHREKQPHSHYVNRPHLPSGEENAVEMASLSQEMSELFTAMAQGDIVEVADGVIDCIYILLGICRKYGFDPTPIWEEVQRSNMDKLPAGQGTLGRRTADGKSCKPEGWVPPKVLECLLEQGWRNK